jgi:hypothetical protein
MGRRHGCCACFGAARTRYPRAMSRCRSAAQRTSGSRSVAGADGYCRSVARLPAADIHPPRTASQRGLELASGDSPGRLRPHLRSLVARCMSNHPALGWVAIDDVSRYPTLVCMDQARAVPTRGGQGLGQCASRRTVSRAVSTLRWRATSTLHPDGAGVAAAGSTDQATAAETRAHHESQPTRR